MTAEPVYRQILLVDIVGSSQLDDREKSLVRAATYGLLAVAFARAGLRWDTCRREDRGDGTFLLISPEVPKPVLAGDLVTAIDGILAQPCPGGGAWPRLRLCLHAGEVTVDGEGSSGRDVDHAFALLDSDAARQAMRSHPAARCMLVVSDPYHDALLHSGADAPWAADFTRAVVPAKLTTRIAWIRLPAQRSGTSPVQLGWEPADSPVPGRVLVGLPDGLICGPGMLVTERHVLTCAHLVPGGPSGQAGVAVTFGTQRRTTGQRAEVVTWTDRLNGYPLAGSGVPDGTGLAVLRLPADPPPSAVRALLADLGHPAPGRTLLVPGSPPEQLEIIGVADGTGALIRVRCLGPARGWPGCAPGEPVVDGRSGAVVGMLVAQAGWPVRDQAVMVCATAAAALWTGQPEQAGAPWLGASQQAGTPWRGASEQGGAPQSYGAGRSRRISVLEFACAVADLHNMETEASRNLIIAELRPEIATTTPRHATRRHDVLALVRTCREYDGGIDELLAVLYTFEGDSTKMRVVLEARQQLDR